MSNLSEAILLMMLDKKDLSRAQRESIRDILCPSLEYLEKGKGGEDMTIRFSQLLRVASTALAFFIVMASRPGMQELLTVATKNSFKAELEEAIKAMTEFKKNLEEARGEFE